VAALLALLGASLWGIGDFFGGVASRRTHVLAVLVASQAVGLAGAAAWTLASNDAWPGAGALLPALGAGVAGAVGLGALYRGMAIGAMGIVAPISAASPVVPLAIDLARGTTPSVLRWSGIALALAGIVLLSRDPGSASGTGFASGVALALVAALGFGLFVVGLDVASDASVPWAILGVRSASTTLAILTAIAIAAPMTASRGLWPMIAAVGVFDTGANVCVAFATTRTSAGVVAVLSALYPVTTIVLARMVLGERLDARRRVGGALALCGAALVAV